MRQSHMAFMESGNSLYTLDRFKEIPVLYKGENIKEALQEKIVSTDSSSSIFPYGPSSGGMVESVYFDILTRGIKCGKNEKFPHECAEGRCT